MTTSPQEDAPHGKLLDNQDEAQACGQGVVARFRPMLAAKADLATLRFPLYASIKLDGVRACRIGGCFVSRTLKPLPNQHLQFLFSDLNEGLDGELIVGSPTAPDCYRRTVSTVMAENASASEVRYYTFDHFFRPHLPFSERKIFTHSTHLQVQRLEQFKVENMSQLLGLEDVVLAQGCEGLILRAPEGPYKFGRSTAIQQWMLKLKRFHDDEARVVGLEELQHNDNAATLDERGYTKRSTHQANKMAGGTLGALVVDWQGSLLRIGTGFDQAQRQEIWQSPNRFIGKMVKFKYFAVGMKDLPRHPVFLGWREGD